MEAQFKYNSGNLEKYRTKNPLKRVMVQRLNRKIIAETKKFYDEGCFTLLDAGCGEGFISRLIKSEIPNIKITGIEYTSEALQIAKAESEGIDFLQGDICNLPFVDNSFDIVLCTEVLEHLKNPEKALLELLRVSKKGLILTVPNEPWFCLGNLMVLKNLSRLGNPIDHINHWTAKGFAKIISNMTGGGTCCTNLFLGQWLYCKNNKVGKYVLSKKSVSSSSNGGVCFVY